MRTQQVHVSLSRREEALVRALGRSRGLSSPELLRSLAVSEAVAKLPREEIERIEREHGL